MEEQIFKCIDDYRKNNTENFSESINHLIYLYKEYLYEKDEIDKLESLIEIVTK